MTRNRPERDFQKQLVNVLRAVYPQAITIHVPNGGSRHVAEAVNLKRMGVVPGVPDLLLIRPCGLVSWIECKAGKGRLSPQQKDIHQQLEARGHEVCVMTAGPHYLDALLPLVNQWKAQDHDQHRRASTAAQTTAPIAADA